MDKLFDSLLSRVRDTQKSIRKMPAPDALIELTDMSLAISEMVSEFVETANDALLDDENTDLDEIDPEIEEYVPDLSLLSQAAVVTLALRGDIVSQLSEAGHEEMALEVKNLLQSVEK